MNDYQIVLPAVVTATLLAVVWVVLAATSRFHNRRSLGLPFVGVSSGESALPYVSAEFAMKIAAERRRKLLKHIGETGVAGVVGREFLEVPPKLDGARERFFEEQDRAAAAVHTAHLWWQLNDDRLLLMERLIDGIVSLQRSEPYRDDLQITAILEPISRKIDDRTYPWRAVIHTAYPDALKMYLETIKDWVGIGVDVLSPIKSHPLGSCGGNGSLGQVGGVLRAQHPANGEYGVTCHHVLAEHCGSLYWPSPPNRPEYAEYENGALDAALIQTFSGCFVDGSAARLPISCATAADRERFIGAKLSVKKSPHLNGRTGNILHIVNAIPGRNGQLIRAPHLQVIPTFTKRLGVTWPLFNRAFSVEGNSGAWITDEQDSLWFGMVVQGSEPPILITHALEAGFLLDAFSRALPLEAPLTPMRLQ